MIATATLKNAVLVTGATGYVGGRLVPRLLASGYHVKAMARSLAKLGCRPWARHPRVELVKADVLDPASLDRAVQGCRAAFYLVHSMISRKRKFAEADRMAARHMAAAAAKAGLERIIYLGGLGEVDNAAMSKHLRSRHEVEEILQAGAVPTTSLRAAMILGSGSASFEILRYLVDRLPVMITPRWVQTPCQPIAIGNVLNYLQGCLENEKTSGQTFDIGGPEVLNYRQIIQIYAEEARLPRRLIIPVPLLTPTLSALWVHLVTPVPSAIAIPLTQGLSLPVVCRDNRIRSIVPQKLAGCRETIRRALDRIKQAQVDTCWTDAGTVHPPEWAYCGDAEYAGGTILECGYRVDLEATAQETWDPVIRVGGERGWYFADGLWWLRGFIDRLLGGIGLRRGRRHPSRLQVGDALDFWRVLEVEPPHRLVLLAEMLIPGEALLEFQITPLSAGRSRLQLLSRFLPRGVSGMLYWYGLYPFHELIFSGMLKSMAAAIGKPVSDAPRRFTPKLHQSCALPAGVAEVKKSGA